MYVEYAVHESYPVLCTYKALVRSHKGSQGHCAALPFAGISSMVVVRRSGQIISNLGLYGSINAQTMCYISPNTNACEDWILFGGTEAHSESCRYCQCFHDYDFHCAYYAISPSNILKSQKRQHRSNTYFSALPSRV